MPLERTRPALVKASVKVEELRDDDGQLEGEVEVHTFIPVPFEPSIALKAAIDAGHVVTERKTKKFDVKDKDGNVIKRFQQDYTTLEAKNRAGATALPGVDGDETILWSMVSSAVDQLIGQPIYVDMRLAGSGPEKQIARIQKILSGMTEDQKLVALKEIGLVG